MQRQPFALPNLNIICTASILNNRTPVRLNKLLVAEHSLQRNAHLSATSFRNCDCVHISSYLTYPQH